MEKAQIVKQYADEEDYELHIIGIPKTIDNDILVTHRCPGYASFAKFIALMTMGLQSDLDSFGLQPGVTRGGRLKEKAVSQIIVGMGRDQGWGVAASLINKLDESYGPHVILTKEGGFNPTLFLDRCQNAWDKYGNLLVVASEGAHDGMGYLAYQLKVEGPNGEKFKVHVDPHKNNSVTDSRLAILLKLLIEENLKIPTEVYDPIKCREEGPGYIMRSHPEIMSAIDFQEAVAVGETAADLAFDAGKSGVMVTLTPNVIETDYTPLENVADPYTGSKNMTKPITSLDTEDKKILSEDGMMIDRDLYMQYISPFLDLNGPNRSEYFRGEGFKFELISARKEWPLEERILEPYV
jgi:6-phosphofructokinase 1